MTIPLGFASGLHDRDTGLVHFGFREYDPAIGRFIQPDPIGLEGGDVDVYGYCHDDPVNFLDRVGLAKFAKRDLDLPTGTKEFGRAARRVFEASPYGKVLSEVAKLNKDKVDEELDEHNVEAKHEHLFYEDGSGENVGLSKEGLVTEEKKDGYDFEEETYDDKRMKRAQKSLEEGEYSVVGNPLKGKKKNNCQDYSDKLRRRYELLYR